MSSFEMINHSILIETSEYTNNEGTQGTTTANTTPVEATNHSPSQVVRLKHNDLPINAEGDIIVAEEIKS